MVSVIRKILLLCALLAISRLGMAADAAMAPDTAALLREYADNPKRLVELGIRYENAEGVARDYAKAAALYCAAARKNDADAQFALGWMYANGRGFEKNDAIAAQLFSKAAANGHEHARQLTRFFSASTAESLPSCLKDDDAQNAAAYKAMYPKGPVVDLVEKLAPKYDVDPQLALAIIATESGFNVSARSRKNAQGLMQLIPETAQRFHVKNAFNAEDNIKGGLAYLQWLLSYFKGDVSLVAAAYNAGEGAVKAHGGIPPYAETRDYVQKVLSLYRKPGQPSKSAIPALLGTGLAENSTRLP
jgi:soluble lytic murein transglycosylase-like protein